MIAGMMRELLAGNQMSMADIASTGVGVPGPSDPRTGVLIEPPNLPEWHNVAFGPMLKDAVGVPTHLNNDARLAAFGEFRQGAGRGSRDMLFVTVSTGIGGGIVIDGNLYEGAGGTAGEVGHTPIVADGPACHCGGHGCLEMVASGTAIARIAGERIAAGEASGMSGSEPLTSKTVADWALRGDALALSVLYDAGHYLGLALGGFINVLDPGVVVLGGGAIQSGAALLDPMHAAIKLQAFESALRHTRVVLAALGQDAGLVGAVEWARAHAAESAG